MKLKYILPFLLILISVFSTSYAFDYDLNEIGPIPIRSMIFLNKKGEPIVLPKKTPYWLGYFAGKRILDPDKLIFVMDGKAYTNPSYFGSTALPKDNKGILVWPAKTLMDNSCNQATSLDSQQLKAIDMIFKTAIKTSTGLTTWLYDFDIQSDDMILFPPYNSSYSQTINIHALLFAYCKTKNIAALKLATQAGETLIAPIEKGGLMSNDSNIVWFQELPFRNGLSQYMLNANAFSIDVLFLLAEVSGEKKFRDAAMKAQASLKKVLFDFDTGYWNRYDLRPRYLDMEFEVDFSPDVVIKQIKLQLPNKNTQDAIYTICEKGCDTSFSSVTNNNSYRFSAVIEALRIFSPDFTNLNMNITYQGKKVPKLFTPGIRPDIHESFEILPSSIRHHAGYSEVNMSVGLRDIGWQATNDYYIKFHAFLLADLWRRVKDPTFFVTSIRWRNYLRVAENERISGTSEYKQRRFQPREDDVIDASIEKCFADIAPTDIDLNKAVPRIYQCAKERNLWPNKPSVFANLLQRMGFIITRQNDKVSVSDGHDGYLLTGSGFSKA